MEFLEVFRKFEAGEKVEAAGQVFHPQSDGCVIVEFGIAAVTVSRVEAMELLAELGVFAPEEAGDDEEPAYKVQAFDLRSGAVSATYHVGSMDAARVRAFCKNLNGRNVFHVAKKETYK